MSKQKIFIIDTNVILFDPMSIFKFAEHQVVIPIVVFEEIDRFKRDMTENGRNARTFSRIIDDLREKGKLSEGVQLPAGGTLRVELGHKNVDKLHPSLNVNAADNLMLNIAHDLQNIHKNKKIVFISKDINLRIKCDAFSIEAEDYRPSEFDHQETEDLYSGVANIKVKAEVIDELYTNKRVETTGNFYPNQFVFMKDESSENHQAIGRYDGNANCIVPVFKPAEGLWGIFPRNAEQTFAFDILMNDEIQLVSLVGKAGTGKTLLALAAGLSKTIDEGKYSRLLVSRPIMPMGKDIGYLPGSIEEKLNPYMQPIFDNIDFLFGTSAIGKSPRRGIGRGCQELMDQGLLSIEPLTYIRGRSIPHQFMIVDEAQNLSPHELKTIITRAGEGTKIVLTGDTMQIDSPYLDSFNNGLAVVVNSFKSADIAGHVTLVKGERSRLSELAISLMP